MEQIEEDAETFDYDMDEVQLLKDYKEPNETSANYSQEKSLKDLRLTYLGYANTTQLGAKMVEINEWYTMIDKKWHVMTIANDKYLLRCIPIKEVGLKRPPYISWGMYPRGVVFWTPGVADIARDPNLAMDVAINQIIDNNTYRNFGMVFVTSSSGLKQSSIVPRPLGVTPINVAPDSSLKDSVMPNTPPEITSGQATMQLIAQLADNAVGTTATPIGQKGKMSVTQQSQLAGITESKNNLLRQNYIKAWQEIGQMYAEIIQDFMTEPRQVKVYGQKAITLNGVTKKNFKDVKFIAKAVSAEISQENKAIKQKAAATLFEMFKDDKTITGQQFLREYVAKQYDLSPTDIDKLFTKEAGNPMDVMQMAQQGQPAQGKAPEIPTNPNNPLLGQTGANAQAQVPPTLK